MARAKELALNLPGGELSIEAQEQIIEMLEKLRDRKRCVRVFDKVEVLNVHALDSQQLEQFSTKIMSTQEDSKMEVDSMASTPVD